MDRQQLFDRIRQKGSYLCVGLDTDIRKIPSHLRNSDDPLFEFNRQIIDATHEYAVAYKPNVAFYESLGPAGWQSLERTLKYIPEGIFTIADAKRGDIGNTSSLYARAFFEQMQFDAVTVAPYMGADSVAPFLAFKNKWTILLACTSNPGSNDFQTIESRTTGRPLYEEVIVKACEWAGPDQLMFVAGATAPERIKRVRSLAPDHFLLVPGIGAQGGSLSAVSEAGMNKMCGLLVNATRSILYASDGKDFAEEAAKEARLLRDEMSSYLDRFL
ncbi:MAG: orotidine-5'-phosphate decarboxylase [Bacteroidota bacterium]|jgi:orotidine-5'-phosphate decarboxylase|nr:MAG: orotidine-5'-phosphate decarboxylase [Bacteroidota bacterium]